MKTPIETLLESANWNELPTPIVDQPGSLPFATHEGVLEIAGIKFRCYRLNTGQAVFEADDVAAFFNLLSE